MPATDAVYPSLKDRVVFISGGASGIGAAMVRHFAAQGSRVGFVDIDAGVGERLVADITAIGQPKPFFVACDLRDIAAYQAAIATVAAALGAITVLVNSAARDDRHDWRGVTPEYWDERLQVNLRHQFFAIQAIAPMMQKAGGGSVINFGSVSWHVAQGGMPAYTSSKAAVEGLTRSFARDLGPDRIRVNCVIPGWILTERQQALWLTDTAREANLTLQCLKEMLYPPDVARLVLWLAAEDSRMCTSQTWTIDGGRS